jgi:predicted O-linked N-acetylglucosamine transferase (SPINDLY family)
MIQSIKQLYGEALALYQAGYFPEAAATYQQILNREPTDVEAWWGLGKIHNSQGNWEQALAALDQALNLDPNQAMIYIDLGFAWQQLGDDSQAILAHQTAIALEPDHSQIYCQLGDLYLELEDYQSAKQFYRQGILIDPSDVSNYLSLGNLLIAQSEIEEAITLYQTALEWQPQNPDLLYQYGLAIATNSTPDIAPSPTRMKEAAFYFGSAAYYQQDYQTAIDYYQTVLNSPNRRIEIYINLADCYQQLDRFSSAIDLYQQALEAYPDSVDLYLAFILALQNLGQTEAAIQIAEKALKILPNNIRLKLAHQRILPILYQTQAEIQFYRQRFQQLLEDLIQNCSLETTAEKQQALQGIAENTNFYVQYQGDNDLAIQQQYGQFVSRIMAANYPEYTQKITHRKTNKIKVGYISAYLQWHTIGILFLGWIKQYNSDLFEIYSYHLGQKVDEITDLFRYYSDNFYYNPHNWEATLQQIIADKIDILVFLDIGMSPQTTQLAGLRLAPIQCAAWGHPVTTGLPTIDYFISAEDLEPIHRKNHYSEQLITLPSLGIFYQKPALPKCLKNRSDFRLKEESIIYLSSQSLFKYLPQYDQIFCAIAQQVKTAQFIFLSHWNSAITQQFKHRLNRTFSQFGLNFKNHCVILPRLSKQNYLRLHLLADIALDTFQFTGFLTSLDAIACNLPIVTHEGQLMRSRQTAGILKRINVTETIAQNQSEYIKIAVRLGLESDWRNSIVEKIKTNQAILYQDNQCIQSLEQFYLSILE